LAPAGQARRGPNRPDILARRCVSPTPAGLPAGEAVHLPATVATSLRPLRACPRVKQFSKSSEARSSRADVPRKVKSLALTSHPTVFYFPAPLLPEHCLRQGKTVGGYLFRRRLLQLIPDRALDIVGWRGRPTFFNCLAIRRWANNFYSEFLGLCHELAERFRRNGGT